MLSFAWSLVAGGGGGGAAAGSAEKVPSAHPLRDQPEAELTVAGIYNQGNSCYLNALLQAMASSSRLCKYFLHLDELLEQEAVYLGSSAQSSRSTLSRWIHSALAKLQPVVVAAATRSDKRAKTLDCSSLQRSVQALFPAQSLYGDDQQDADEVLLVLLDVVEKESKRAWQALAPSLLELEGEERSGMRMILDPFWGDASSSSNYNSKPVHRPTRVRLPVQSPLLGNTFLLLQCTRCGRKSPLRPDPFSVLALRPVSSALHDCLRDFAKREEIEDYFCEHCRRKVRAVTRNVIGKPPLVLCIKLMRNEFVNGRMCKNRTVVDLPDVLDVKPVCFFHILASSSETATAAAAATGSAPASNSPWKQNGSSRQPVTANLLDALAATGGVSHHGLPRQLFSPSLATSNTTSVSKSTEYRLMAVIEHEGSAFGGHFVAYRRMRATGNMAAHWLRCSDDRVSRVDSLRNVQCYMCFYQRA